MGDFQANFKRQDTGIHTVEGNVAGSRAALLSKKREKEQQEFEAKRQKIHADAKTSSIDKKFAGKSTASRSEQTFRTKTVGLVTAEEFKKAQEEQARGGPDFLDIADHSRRAEEQESSDEMAKRRKIERKKKKKKLKEKKKLLTTLSFANEEEEVALLDLEDDSVKKIAKDPSVNTDFLPDKQREEDKTRERERLETEWKERQKQIKLEKLEIIYSYWDGSGHRRSVTLQKGDSIGHFLELVRRDLSQEFREMQNVASDALMYVKEDLILPSDVTFYDLIATKARGKSGPLFNFDVHDDVRIGPVDSRVEKDESHPGKVVERRWYERNKHIFPASRWENFDPLKTYERYTVHGGEVNKKRKK